MSYNVNADIERAKEDAKKLKTNKKTEVIIPPPLQMDKNGCWKNINDNNKGKDDCIFNKRK